MTPCVCGSGGLGALNALGRLFLVLVKHGLGAVMLIMYGRWRRPFGVLCISSRDGLIRGYLPEAVFAIASGQRLSQVEPAAWSRYVQNRPFLNGPAVTLPNCS